ncbi:hypothetical protein [Dactylosporangium matsuzakiense]|uniref:hypothetical protein n=1 Tax=Dactylosporangium matsuzakiense TaxID=53360 RepID=UPI0021C4524D|nr:hypothetical protein [Dactylosporangium matsuzakiense]UWZ47912.1 hypothetical protein Dmats_16840 [Dactylosporangium matsuzakiense]
MSAAHLDAASVATGPDRAAAARLLWEMPVTEAVAAVRSFGDWRPPGPAAAAVFDRLAAADPDVMARAAAEVPALPAGFAELALSGDGTRLAGLRYGPRKGVFEPAITEWEIDTGRALSHYAVPYDPDDPGRARPGRRRDGPRLLVYAGDTIIAVDPHGIGGYAGGHRRTLDPRGDYRSVARLGDGFAALRSDGLVVLGTATRISARHRQRGGHYVRLAAAPDGAHLAILAHEQLIVLDGHGREVQHRGPADLAPPELVGVGLMGVAFHAADGLAVLLSAATRERPQERLPAVIVWLRLTAGRLHREGVSRHRGMDIDGLDGTGLLALHSRNRRVVGVVDPRRPAAPPPLAEHLAGARVTAAAGRIATDRAGALTVRPTPGPHLLNRPMRDVGPGDVTRLAAAVTAGAGTPAVCAAMALLHACTLARLDTEISLGDLGVRPGDEDIALGGAHAPA